MSLNPKDFKTLDIKISSDKTTIEVSLEAHPNGCDTYDEDKKVFVPNPNYRKWYHNEVRSYLKSEGHDVGKYLGGPLKLVTNGPNRRSNVMLFELKTNPTKTTTSKNDETEPGKEPKPKSRPKRQIQRKPAAKKI